MFKLKGENFIYFEPEELTHLCKIYVADIIAKNLSENKQKITDKLNLISDVIDKDKIKKILLKKENIEFLTSIVISKFYEKDVKIGFLIKNKIQIEKLASKIIESKELKILIDNVEEDTDCDFIISSSTGIRKFQLKQCREKLNTKNLFEYIKKKLDVYGTLGDTNLIILAQGNGSPEQSKDVVNISEIYQKIKTLNYNFNGEVLIIRTTNGINFFIYEVYPKKRKYEKKINYKEFMQIDEEITKQSLIKHEL